MILLVNIQCQGASQKDCVLSTQIVYNTLELLSRQLGKHEYRLISM